MPPAHLLTADTSDNSVPTRIIETAILLYGKRGCHAVSAREIIREAGVLNEAAIRYYFGKKADLLKACMGHINQQQLQPFVHDAWADLEQLKTQGPISVRDIVAMQLAAFFGLYMKHRPSMQLIARLIREEGANGQDVLLDMTGDMIWRFEAELAEVLPEKTSKALRLQVFLAINSMVNGLVDQSLLQRLPTTDLNTNEKYYHLAADELLQGFLDYVSAGIAGHCGL